MKFRRLSRRIDKTHHLKMVSEDFIDQIAQINPAIRKAQKSGERFTVSVRFGKSGGFDLLFVPSITQVIPREGKK